MRETLEEELDRLAVTQAFVDAEMATARVIDLTERLVDSRDQIVALNTELERLRTDFRQLQTEHEQMRSSAAFRLADRIWTIRNALGL